MTEEEPLVRSGPSGVRSPLTMRLVSAVILIPIALAVVAEGGIVFAAFTGIAVMIMAWEWVRICTGGRFDAGDALLPAGLMAAAVLAALGKPVAALLAGAVGSALSAVPASWRMRRGRADGLWLAIGGLYLAAAVTSTLWLRGSAGGFAAFMWLLLLVWSTDTGAYAFGRLVGGPAFLPQFSPNKTWAGVVGGVAAAVVAGVLASEIGFRPQALGVGRGMALVPYAVLFAVAVQAGDILESAAKRHFGVKDSSRLIPGHGGLLDRLDGFLLAVSVAALCTLLHADVG